eukprot:TRINITY_DN415_c0_g1_i1.p1 TRINITY_DN415_c0_g1~~TRINITY_DN415_c0_g1_i1.p1  ORF type:complete len:317 (+),score=77.92 TRINITY_DN415_c0_g1_i1:201-1151(+)
MMDYKLEFVDEDNISDSFLCPICNDIFDDSIILNCGHSFCKSCIGMSIKNNNLCPVCRDKIKTQIKNLVLNNIISEFNVYCKEKDQGCNWMGKKESFENHVSYCELNKENTLWECINCKYKNKSKSTECSSCNIPKENFTCTRCTFINPNTATHCQVCEHEREKKIPLVANDVFNRFIGINNNALENENDSSSEDELFNRFIRVNVHGSDDEEAEQSSPSTQDRMNINFYFNRNQDTSNQLVFKYIHPKQIKSDVKNCLKNNPRMKQDMCFTILSEKYQDCEPNFLSIYVTKFHKKVKKRLENRERKKKSRSRRIN